MNELLKSGKLFTGINYWASNSAINMWENEGWNEEIVDNDLKKLSQCGISVLRVFPLWSVFQPISAVFNNFEAVEYRFGEMPLPNTEAGRAGVSEEACLKFERFCKIAEKNGLKLIVGLLTGHMSGRYYAPPAFQGRNLITDPTLIKWEIRFVKYFVNRFKNESCIVGWDLGNECCGFDPKDGTLSSDTAYVWASAISGAIKQSDSERPVISGYDVVPIAKEPFNILDSAETFDIHTVHPYNIFHTEADPLISMRSILDSAFKCRLYSDLGKVPAFVQEIGSIGYTNCSEKTEAEFYRALLFSVWAHGFFGVMWWCAFDQGEFDYAPYDLNNIGSDYGFFKSDGSKKPIADENISFNSFLSGLPIGELPPMTFDAVCIVPRSNGSEYLDMLRTTYCLAKQAGLNIKFSYYSDELPSSDIYILPSVDGNQAISGTCYRELIKRVENGAALYISLGKALFRKLPQISGLNIAYREGNCGEETVRIENTELRLTPDFKYHIESCKAQILATGEDGRAVYVKNKYKKGCIYLSTIPIEKNLTNRNGAFNSEGALGYPLWYKAFASEFSKKALSVQSEKICATEHIADENLRYAVLINYSCKPLSAKISLSRGWEISEVCYGSAEEQTVHIPQCDCVVLRLTRGDASKNNC